MQPVNALFEERVAAGHRLIVPPVVGSLEPLDDRGEVREHHLPDHALAQQTPQADRQRLVVVVLSHEYDSSSPVTRRSYLQVVLHPEVGRLLDQHVLAGRERLEREIEMKTRRHRDDHCIHRLGLDGCGVAVVARRTAITPAAGLRLRTVTAGVAAENVVPQGHQVPAVDAGDEAAAEKREVQRPGHRLIIPAGPDGQAARGRSPPAFDRRCIPADGVASRSSTASVYPRRALSGGRMARLGATRDFFHKPLSRNTRHAGVIVLHRDELFTHVVDRLVLRLVVGPGLELRQQAKRDQLHAGKQQQNTQQQ